MRLRDQTPTEPGPPRQLLLLPEHASPPPPPSGGFWQRLVSGFASELRLQWRWLQRQLALEARLRQLFGPRAAAAAAAQPELATAAATTPGPALGADSGHAVAKLRRRFEARREARERRQQRRMPAKPLDPRQPELPLVDAPARLAEPTTELDSDPLSMAASAPPTAAPPLPSPAPAQLLETAFANQPYELPTLDLLASAPPAAVADPIELEQKKLIIQQTLDSFSIDAEVGAATRGPRVSLFEVSPARGVKVEAISRIANNLAMDLAAVSLRILTPVPGQDFVGIEVPNRHSDTVFLGSLLQSQLWHSSRARIPLPLGRNISGADMILDLAQAPHLLIAGATGSGKSVCLNTMLLALLYRFAPSELRLILVDPKVVEFSVYNALPHLVLPVITEHSNVVLALRWVIREMERRYRLLAKVGTRNIQSFNSRGPDSPGLVDDAGQALPAKLPLLVVVIDELADIMLAAKSDVENCLARIAQMSRAVGIHTIIATQRPSVDVITGIIKANYPTRIAFQVSSQIDSRTILDGKGAERLLGSGDMLFKPPGAARLQRLQSAMVTDQEIEAVVTYAASQSEQCFDLSILQTAAASADSPLLENSDSEAGTDENLISDAIDIITQERRASTSYLQRRLRIGYNRAATIMETLEERGLVGPQLGSGKREILIDTPITRWPDNDELDPDANED